MNYIRTIIILMATMLTWTLNAQVDTIITVTGELGNPESNLDFLDETGRLTRFPRLTDVGELLYYPPIVTTDSVTNITHSSAIVYGNILFNGWCENVLEQGFQISTTADFSESVTSHQVIPSYFDCELPCLGNAYYFTFIDLTSSNTYYVRAYATNSVGTAYGDAVTFTTTTVSYEEWDGTGQNPNDTKPCKDAITVKDYDNNIYHTVIIGNQCWIKENLKTTKYTDGTSISQGSSTSTTVAYWYYPNNSSSNKTTYGLLYNWKAVMRNSSSSSANPSGVQGICPIGWHVPSYAEWTQLKDYVSSQSQYRCNSESTNIAKALASTTGWNGSTNNCAVGNNQSGNNVTGFSAVPAGCYNRGGYSRFGYNASLWSATAAGSPYASSMYLNYGGKSTIWQISDMFDGRSVRCIRD